MLDDVVLTQFAWEGLKIIGGEMATAIWDKIKESTSERFVAKLQNLVENNQEGEFKEELKDALEKNGELVKKLDTLHQNITGQQISVNVGNVNNVSTTGENSIINFGVMMKS